MTHQNNPLLERIPKFKEPKEFIPLMRYSPLDGIAISNLSFLERQSILLSGDSPYAPLSSSIRVASVLYGMMCASYESRNPLKIVNRQSLLNIQVGLKPAVSANSSLGVCSGYIIKGITGTGKTAALSRFSSLFPDSIVHSKNQSAGWAQQVQIPVLVIAMPDEGSRGGFIQSILDEIDRITGQEYSQSYNSRIRSVDKLAIKVIALLHRYFVGLLIVEEVQLRNLQKSSQASVMQLFLLSIMNAGIPLVLVGNPLGFDWINESSQDRRRLNHGPAEFLHPMEIQNSDYDEDWGHFFESVYQYYVLDGKPEGEKTLLSRVLRSLSGGLPDLAMSLWKNAQNKVLFEEVSEKSVNEGTLKTAYLDEGFNAMRPIADGFTYRNPLKFIGCNDIPSEYYEEKWGNRKDPHDASSYEDNSSIQVGGKIHTSNKSKRVPTEKSKLKRKITLEKNKKAEREMKKKTLPKEDIRMQGVSDLHIGEFRGIVGKDEDNN